MKNDYLVVSDRVQQAIDKKMPVIAVETAQIYLGLTGNGAVMDGIGTKGVKLNEGEPPNYFKIANNIGNLIVQNGAVPAMIAVIDGKIHVGLGKADMQYLHDHHDNLKKICQSDLPLMLIGSNDGVTTLSATMMIAQMVGISVVVTIGVGGVSEDYADTHHVSADIEEMVHNRVVVVATGLTPGSHPERSLRFFDTHGIPVIGFRTDSIFTRWMSEFSHPLKYRVNDPTDIAATLAVKRSLDIDGAILVFNPAAKVITDEESYNSEINSDHIIEILNDNVTLAAWIAMAISMDLDPNIDNRGSKRSTIPKKEKSMSFEVWLFAVKKFAQNYDVALLIFNNLPESEKERLRQEYEDTVD
ncbi:MAG: pseudouridine-5'-phosphate glycosidase [Eubacterium sp.]|nr:pseudouridine-5'-phosphate glycosidase [Eubacterium sp.]